MMQSKGTKAEFPAVTGIGFHDCAYIMVLEEKNKQLLQENQELQKTVELLKGRLRNEVKNRFDKKSEKLVYLKDQSTEQHNWIRLKARMMKQKVKL